MGHRHTNSCCLHVCVPHSGGVLIEQQQEELHDRFVYVELSHKETLSLPVEGLFSLQGVLKTQRRSVYILLITCALTQRHSHYWGN